MRKGMVAACVLVACGGASTGGDPTPDVVPPAHVDPPASVDAPPPASTTAEPPAPPPPQRPTPPPFPTYSKGTCPTLVTGATKDTSMNTAFATGSQSRAFRVIVPKSYDSSKPWPLVIAWHWLNASGGSMVDQGELESATEQMKFIAIVPEKLENGDGKKTYQFDWPFVETWGASDEITFTTDMLACVTQQLSIDPTGVYAIGVSAGALWVTYLSTQPIVKHFAAIESLSGGLGSDPTGTWKMAWTPQPRKFPAIVLWGGPTDNLGILDFQKASIAYRAALEKDGHFVVTCTHNAGHAMPPIPEPTDGTTRFAMLWRFMLDHPYGLLPGESPYTKTGLPQVFPSWCAVTP